MFVRYIKKTSKYLKSHPGFACIYSLALSLGFLYLFHLNVYVLEATSQEASYTGSCCQLENKPNAKGIYEDLTTFASNLGGEGGILFDVVDKQILSLLSGGPEKPEVSKNKRPK